MSINPIDVGTAPDDDQPEVKNDVVDEPVPELDPEAETAAGTEPNDG